MIDHRSALSAPDSLLHRLEALHAQLDLLTRTRDYFIELEKAEALSHLARDLFARGQTTDAIQAYRDLVAHAEAQRGTESAAAFVRRVAEQTWLAGRAVLAKRLLEAAEALSWPASMAPGVSRSEKAAPFRAAFRELIDLQQTCVRLSCCSFDASRQAPSDASSAKERTILPLEVLVQPLTLRFRYHFDGKRQTNRLDKVCLSAAMWAHRRSPNGTLRTSSMCSTSTSGSCATMFRAYSSLPACASRRPLCVALTPT